MGDELVPDWGFSALVETENSTILFDTGGDGEILMGNMRAMGIDPAGIDMIFLSHNHFDHIGGLSAAIRSCPDALVVFPPSLRGIKRAGKKLVPGGAMEIAPGVFTTGELHGIEQPMMVRTSGGSLLVAGCSHPGLKPMLEAAGEFGRVEHVLGGLHGFDEFALLENLNSVCPTHCTRNIRRIEELFPKKYLPGGAGRRYCYPHPLDSTVN